MDVPADDLGVLQDRFESFSKHSQRDSPLYAEISATVAADRSLAELLMVAPATQRQPVLWLAAVHDALLRDPTHPLAAHYPDLSEGRRPRGPLAETLRRFVAERRDDLRTTMATRHTQTNEIGRCALLLPMFDRLSAEVGVLHHVDVGASAGLNLLWSQYGYRYQPGPSVNTDSPLTLDCDVSDFGPLPEVIPPVATAIGLDPLPVDLANPEHARWLVACVWPDQVDRIHRLRAAIELANARGVSVREGSATRACDVVGVVDEADESHPVITTSWVLNYLSPDGRTEFVRILDDLGARRDLSAVFIEHPGLCPELPGMPSPDPQARSIDGPTAMVLVTWRSGERRAIHVAKAHPHGRWLRGVVR